MTGPTEGPAPTEEELAAVLAALRRVTRGHGAAPDPVVAALDRWRRARAEALRRVPPR